MKRTGYTKLLAHHHTGKIRHHKHTSYGSLTLILLLTFIPVLTASRAVASAATDGGGSYDTYAVVLGAAPATAPTMVTVFSGQTFTTSDPVKISGACPAGTLVKIFKNEILGGATLCQGGQYQLSIDLFVGNNGLVARAYNTNDVAGPDSPVVSVQLVLPNTNSGTHLNSQGAPAGQLYVTSEQLHKGANTGDTMTWPVTIAGGQAPYKVTVSWGDGKSDSIDRTAAGQFDISHVYSEPSGSRGSYTVVVKVTDKAGTESFIQLVAIVSGDAQVSGIVGGVTGGYNKSTAIRTAWQVLAITGVVVVSLWGVEKFGAKLIHRPHYGV